MIVMISSRGVSYLLTINFISWPRHDNYMYVQDKSWEQTAKGSAQLTTDVD